MSVLCEVRAETEGKTEHRTASVIDSIVDIWTTDLTEASDLYFLAYESRRSIVNLGLRQKGKILTGYVEITRYFPGTYVHLKRITERNT